MISRFGPLLAAAVLLVAPALQAASNYTIRPPVLGYVLDAETGSLHRIDGIPGASSMGEALELGFTAVQVAVSAGQNLAIARDDQGRTLFVDLTAEPPAVTEIHGVLEGATQALISPEARSATLYAPATGQIQFLRGLPGVPTAGNVLELEQGVGDWTGFAISDSGSVLAAASARASGSLYLLRQGRVPERVGGVQRASSLAFLAGTDDAVVMDSASGEILLYREVTARRQVTVLASETDEIQNPFAAAPTSDGRFVAVAMPGRIASVPVYGGVPSFVECACTATSMRPLAGGNVFLLTDDIRSPLTIAEVGADSRTLFVPALPAEEASGEQTQ